MALFHYLKIPELDRSAVAWNNLGVSLDELSMPGKSVDAYRKAEELDQTLAMSNLGNKFLSAGFINEAQAECDKAMTIENYHPNVATLIASVKNLPQEEDDKQKKKLEDSKPKIEFYKLFGTGISHVEPKALAAIWQGPNCLFDLKLSGNPSRSPEHMRSSQLQSP